MNRVRADDRTIELAVAASCKVAKMCSDFQLTLSYRITALSLMLHCETTFFLRLFISQKLVALYLDMALQHWLHYTLV